MSESKSLNRFIESLSRLFESKSNMTKEEYQGLLKSCLSESKINIIKNNKISGNPKPDEPYKELSDMEKGFKNIVENCPFPIVIHSKFIAKYINTAALKTLGFSNEKEILGKNIWSYVDPKYHNEAKQKIDSITKRKKHAGIIEECFIRPDGKKIYVEVTATPIEYDGQPATQVIFRDVTEIKYLNERLNFSEIKYRSLYENSSIPILLLKNELIFDCNQKALELFELTQARLIGYSIEDYSDKSNNIKIFLTNIKKAINGERIFFEWQFLKNHKYPFLGEVTLSSFKANEETIILAVINDITEEKQAKQDLERIFTKSLNPIVILDSRFNISKINPAFKNIIGKEEAKLLNKSFYDFVYEQDKLKTSIIFKNIKNNDFSITEFQNRIISENNTQIWISWNIQQLFYDNNYFLIGHDVTSKILTEHELISAKLKALEAANLKTAFIANMSHEIRTPLNGIRGFAQLISQPDLNEEKKIKYSNLINVCSDQLLKIVSDIIDISKIDSGQLVISTNEFNLNEMLDELYFEFKNELINKEKNKIELLLKKVLNDNESLIISDKARLIQILKNLILNAIKFTFQGKIEFGYYEPKGDKKIIFYVKDTGVGIEKSKINQIYERFNQINHKLIKKQSGTGLGLPISKGIVELLGGNIWVESEVDKGTTFFFYIDYKKGSKNIIEYHEKIDDFSSVNWSNYTLLIVDDVQLIYHYFHEVLAPSKINLLYAQNGNSAIDIFKKNPNIDLIFMDIQLPDINGLELTPIIKKIRNVPVIAQTAFALFGDKEKALNAGCDDYITKPFEKNIILKTIGKILRNKA